MTMDIEATLKRAYLANGGTETGFEAAKPQLISQYRNRATIDAAFAEANRKPDVNQIIRDQLAERRTGSLERFFSHTQKGASDEAA